MHVQPTNRLLFVHQTIGTGSDCCGDLGAVADHPSCRKDFALVHAAAQEIGRIYNAVRERYDPEELVITFVDPRAQLVLWVELWRHIRLFHPPLRTVLRLLTQSFSLPAVIVNGRILSARGQLPSTQTLLKKLQTTA